MNFSLPEGHPVLAHVASVRAFIQCVRDEPTILHASQLAFFANFMRAYEAQLPPPPPAPRTAGAPKPSAASPPSPRRATADDDDEPTQSAAAAADDDDSDPSSEESDDDMAADDVDDGVVPADTEPFPELGPSGGEVSDDARVAAGAKKMEAMEAASAGDHARAVELLTEVVKLAPSALNYARRAQMLLKVSPPRPVACIRDCDAALALNPDSAKALKMRGKANRMLGKWEEASNDLRRACRIDFDPETEELRRVCDAHTARIEAKRAKLRAKERRHKERTIRRRRKAAEKARQEARAAAKKRAEAAASGAGAGGMPGMPGMGGAGGGMGIPPGLFNALFSDPELAAALKKPHVMQALLKMMQDPSSMAQYASDPDVMAVYSKLMSKLGGMGGVGGMGGMGGAADGDASTGDAPMPGAGASAAPATEPSYDDDDLD